MNTPKAPQDELESEWRDAQVQVDTLSRMLQQADAEVARLAQLRKDAEHAALLKRIEEAPTEPVPIPDPRQLKEFYLTFGVGYSPHSHKGSKHPAYPDRISGAGFITIEAPTYAWARGLAWVHVGDKFGSVYQTDPRADEPGGNRYWYRAGEIGRMDAYGNLVWSDDVWRALL